MALVASDFEITEHTKVEAMAMSITIQERKPTAPLGSASPLKPVKIFEKFE